MPQIIEKPCALEERDACVTALSRNLVQDVLAMIRYDLSLDRSRTASQIRDRISGLVRAANDLAQCHDTTPDQLTVSDVAEGESKYLDHLSHLRLSSGSSRQRKANRKTLLSYARKFGFSPDTFSILNEWEPILAVLPRDARAIAKDSIRRKRYPADFSVDDLATWARSALESGRSIASVGKAKSEFVRAIRVASPDIQRLLPELDLTVRKLSNFRLRIEDMPESIRNRVVEAIDARREQAKIGMSSMTEVTERMIILCFERLCGYAIHICHMKVQDLDALLEETFIKEFAFWQYSDRKCKRTSVVHSIGLIFSTLKYSPCYKNRDFSWVYGIFRKIPKDPESELKSRRRQRHVEFNKLAAVPARITAERTALQDSSLASAAWLAHDGLLLACLVLAQYPSQFVRQARLGTNLFKAPIPRDSPPFKIPAWAKEVLASEEGAQFWQFRHESNDGQVFRGLVLRPMIPLLEEYLHWFRPLLVGAGNLSDPGTLFFNRVIRPMSPHNFGQHLAQLTHRYLGKCVTSTAIRSSFAYHWRQKHPGKDAVLANIQWIQYATIKLRYDEQFRLLQRARANHRNHR